MNERALRVAGLGLVAAAAGWAAFRMAAGPAVPYGDGQPVGRPAHLGLAAGGGGASTDVDPAQPLPKIPDRLPSFTLGDRAGNPTSIDTWRDKSLIINFWATWCAPCRREIPMLQSLNGEWSGRDVQVVGIAVDHRPDVVTYADKLKIGYPVLIGEQDALTVAGELGFASPVFPFTVFTDRRGDVVTLFVGELHRVQADLILSVVQELNDNRLPLAQARRNIADGLHGLAPQDSG